MKQQTGYFAYDFVLSLTSSLRLRECLPTIDNTLEERKILAATLNHRFYNLHDKNFIKGSIEAHKLDHIMFSMRPSSNRLVSECGDDIDKFKDLSQIVFVLQVMGRYDIPAGIIESNYLDAAGKDSVSVGQIEDKVITFLDELTERFSEKVNPKKQWPWLFSVADILPKIHDRKLIFLKSFSSKSEGSPKYDYNDHQIGNLEKDLFWVGFDATFKQAPLDKDYPTTKWTERARQSASGKGLFEGNLRYCTRCCLPETMEGISFDEVGICVPCRSSEEKMHIDWEKRQHALEAIIESYRSQTYYDCMLPMSGGKDSIYQAHILNKIFKVTPLAVTHGHNWLSLAGRYNLENCLQKFDLDHMIFHMNRAVIEKVARKSLSEIGDACWHCHIGAGTFSIQSAVGWKLGLTIWGESIAEADGRSSYYNQAEASPLYNLEISARVKAEDMADESTPKRDLSAWFYPSPEELKSNDIRYIHLGNYFFWDEERQVEFVKRNYEWMESPVENTYKGYKSVECVMAGVHDYANFIKRGIGRATIHASTDVKRGLLTREEGFELAKKFDTQRPHALDFYLRLTGLSEEEFELTLKEARAKSEYAMKLGDGE